MLEIKNATLRIGGKLIVGNFSFVARDGCLSCVVGPRQSGKSALLETMTGMRRLDSGFVSVDGELLVPATAPFFRARMAFVTQHCSAPGPVTVGELFSLLMSSRDGHHAVPDRRQATSAWGRLNVEGKAWDSCFNSLSESVRKRVMLSFVECMKRDTLIVDGPTEGLLPDDAEAVTGYLMEKANAGTAVLAATADDAFASRCACVARL